jgi:hypothetical protein
MTRVCYWRGFFAHPNLLFRGYDPFPSMTSHLNRSWRGVLGCAQRQVRGGLLGEFCVVYIDKRAARQEIEDGIMLSPRQLEAAFHGEKETQTSPEDRPEAAGS